MKAKVRSFLEHPDAYMDEAKSRITDHERTKTNIEQSIYSLGKEFKDNILQEQRALRLLSEQAFLNEQNVLISRRTWLQDEIARQKCKLESLNKQVLNIESIESIRKLLQNNLDKATNEDWRYIFETLEVKVLMFDHKTWDVQITVPILSKLCTTHLC